jgi:threonine/homoserine/homoserine lactone efflux protein
MMVIGTLGGLGLGASTPIFILFWGQFTDVFNSSADVIVEQARQQLLKFIYLGIGTMIMGWAMMACWLITG